MTLDSLFTVAGLLIAAYAILPVSGRMNIAFRMGAIGWAVAGGAFLLILYLQFYLTFRVAGLTPGLGLAKWGITPGNASFLVVLCAAAFLFFYARRKNLSPFHIGKFEELVRQLRREKNYAELFVLIEDNLSWLERVYFKDFLLYRMHAALTPPPSFGVASLGISNPDAEKGSQKEPYAVILKARRLLSSFFPNGKEESHIVANVIRMLTDDREAAKAMASVYPEFALSVLGKEFPLKIEFADAFLTALMQDEKSALYEEIKEGHCVDSKGYQFPDRQRILGFLFGDCKKAEELQIWRPVGEFIIKELNTLDAAAPYSPDPFNAPIRDEYGVSVRRSEYEIPLLAGVRFFDIMVSRALVLNVQWHMWLYYFHYFTDKALRNLNPDARADMSDEFPTLYHRFLYEIVACLRGWISCIEGQVPTTQENASVKYTDTVDENESIVKSSMLCMGDVTKQIMLSDKVHLKFKYYIMDMVFGQCLSLMRNQKTNKHGKALLNAVICGGMTHCGILIDMKYKDFLLEAAHHGKAIDVPVWGGTLVAQLRQTIEAAKVRERY